MLRVSVEGRLLQFDDVDDAQTVTVGRDPDAVVRIDDPRISRRHAEIRFEGVHWIYHDIQSRNGSFRDGERVDSVAIDGSVDLRLGDRAYGVILQLAAVEDITAAQPEEQALLEHAVAGGGGDSSGGVVATLESADAVGPMGKSILAARALGDLSAVYRPGMALARIGRAADNDIVIDDPLVSRHHAELQRDVNGSFELIDLNSHNGTYLNGQRITRAILSEADYVNIGHHLFRLSGATLEAYIDTGAVTFEAHNLTVRSQAGDVLLDDLTFMLGKQSFMAVVGPTGAGKSTLLNALTGYRPANRGTVSYASRDLYTSYESLRYLIGYVPQEDIIHTQLTVRAALEYAAELRLPGDMPVKERQHRVAEVMDELGLTERADVLIERLSGGQRKRCNIALELLTKPSLLFLDEPTSGLDPGYEKSLMTLFSDLAKGGRTVIVVTHSVQSLEMCDRVLFLAPGGRLAYFGPPDEALGYFEETDYANIFDKLEHDRTTDWKARFRQHSLFNAYIQEPMVERHFIQGDEPVAVLPPEPAQEWMHQFSTLTRRYISVLSSDRGATITLLAQEPVLGILMLLLPANTFVPLPTRGNPNAQLFCAVLVFAGTFMGFLNAVREIVKELPIYRRERAVGLTTSSYVASKFVVLAGLMVVQSIVFVLFAIQRQGGLTGSATGLWPFGELCLDIMLAGIAALALALLISAFVNTSEKAMTALPIVLVAEIILSGALLPLSGVATIPAEFASANWGFSAVASTMDLPTLTHKDHPRWDRSLENWGEDVLALFILTAIPLGGTVWVLRRRDPYIMRAGSATVSVAQLIKHPKVRAGTASAATQIFHQALATGTVLVIGYLLHRLF